jgi:predicted transcriptional regulator
MSRIKREGSFHFLNAKLPDSIFKRVEKYSEQTRIPKTAIVEKALLEYLDRVCPEPKN